MLRLSMPLISVHDLPAAIRSRSRSSSSGVQRILGITQSFASLQHRARPGSGSVPQHPGVRKLRADRRARQQCLSLQVGQHDLAGFFGLSQRFEGRAANRDGARFLMMHRTPGRHEAGSSVKAGTAAALITDHERKAVAAPAPYFHVRDGIMTRVNSMAIPTARPTSSAGSADDQTLSPKDGFKHGSGAIPAKPRANSETGHRFAGGVPASSDTGAAADSPGGLPRAREPGDLHAPGDRFPAARSSSE